MGKFRTITACIGASIIFFCLGCGVVAIPVGGASPSISQVYPQTIAAGSQSTTLKVMGSNFNGAAVIQWNGNALPTSVVDANTLAASVQSSDLASPSVVALTVHN
ncbi:MAG: IPT/TIG domain-containing protein, partial [Candidatus Acidiferrales bacterium]